MWSRRKWGDYICDLIEKKYRTRQDFCVKTGINEEQLNKILVSKLNLSLSELLKVVNTLNVVLIIKPAEEISENVTPERAVEYLDKFCSNENKL